ncbi:MAG: hypothetical protein KatS3mg104_0221 [Phycisphaerae bacterium]|jgi:hypothetical protein|nr:MAG: hypothetical protein KatS3mg104_0221 [Phycisphaerae bacterium]
MATARPDVEYEVKPPARECDPAERLPVELPALGGLAAGDDGLADAIVPRPGNPDAPKARRPVLGVAPRRGGNFHGPSRDIIARPGPTTRP